MTNKQAMASSIITSLLEVCRGIERKTILLACLKRGLSEVNFLEVEEHLKTQMLIEEVTPDILTLTDVEVLVAQGIDEEIKTVQRMLN